MLNARVCLPDTVDRSPAQRFFKLATVIRDSLWMFFSIKKMLLEEVQYFETSPEAIEQELHLQLQRRLTDIIYMMFSSPLTIVVVTS